MATLTASEPALSIPSGASCAGERGTSMRLEWLRRALAVMGCCVMFAAVSACGGAGGGGGWGGGLPILPPTTGPAPQQPAPAPTTTALCLNPFSRGSPARFTFFFCGYLPAGDDQ